MFFKNEYLMLANSNKQKLSKHSFAIACVALELFKNLNLPSKSQTLDGVDNLDNFKKQIILSALFHDIGKIDVNFQSFIKNKKEDLCVIDNNGGSHIIDDKKFSFEEYPRHNEISWVLFNYFINLSGYKNIKENISYVIYYHHENIKRKEEFNDISIFQKILNDNNSKYLFEHLFNFIDEIKLLSKDKSDFKIISEISINEYQDNNDILDNCIGSKPPLFLFDKVCKRNLNSNSNSQLKLEDFFINNEAEKILLRSLIVSADRIISSHSFEELDEIIKYDLFNSLIEDVYSNENNLYLSIASMIENFRLKESESPENKQRNLDQKEASFKLSKIKKPSILFGPAGCGKTKIFLEWYKNSLDDDSNNYKKLFIIAPRKTICENLYDELKKDYIPDSSIELILGDQKKRYDNGLEIDLENTNAKFQSSVIITTIDQIICSILSHQKIDLLIDLLNSYVVFDEFHEFADISGVVLIFKLIVELKNKIPNSKTLLVSATPNYYFLENVLSLNLRNVIEVNTFNNCDYEIKMDIYNVNKNKDGVIEDFNYPLFKKQENGSIVVFNTAKKSQESSLNMLINNSENVINFHSKFTNNDKLKLLNKIKSYWGKKDISIDNRVNYVLRSGPIVQASLNISTHKLLTDLCSAENWCQRLGRVNRFADKNTNGCFITAVPDFIINSVNGFGNYHTVRFLDKMAYKNQTVEWIMFLNSKILLNNIKLNQIYAYYKEFHQLDNTKKAYAEDYKKILLDSLNIFKNNDFKPYLYSKKIKKNNKSVQVLSAKGLRGSSLFILPVYINLKSKEIKWLYSPNPQFNLNNVSMSIPSDQINISYIANHRTFVDNYVDPDFGYKKFNKKTQKIEEIVKNQARNSNLPILVSFVSRVNKNIFVNKLNELSNLCYIEHGNTLIGLMNYEFKLDNLNYNINLNCLDKSRFKY